MKNDVYDKMLAAPNPVKFLSDQLDAILVTIETLRTTEKGLFDTIRMMNEMLGVAVDAFGVIADPKTGCDWVARKSSIEALKKIGSYSVASLLKTL